MKNKEFRLSPEQIQKNYNTFIKAIKHYFPERSDKLIEMYKDLGKDRIMFAPASSTDYYHNAIPGGYVDHVLRVMNFAQKEYEHMKSIGIDVSSFSKKELLFAALNHDLGKLGYPGEGNEAYLVNDSEWHRINQGKMYKTNENNPFLLTPDCSLFILQLYGIRCTLNEYIAIRAHDGMYDDANVPYFKSYKLQSKSRNYMLQILHNADMNATRFEFERWNKVTGRLRTSRNSNIDSILLKHFKEENATLTNQAQNKQSVNNLEKEFEEKFND